MATTTTNYGLKKPESTDLVSVTPFNDNFDKIDEILGNISKKIYPVGSIYMSVNSVNPSTIFGGTWEQLKDRFLLGCGDAYINGATGGEATHTLTVNEMPSHTHGNSETGIAWGDATGNRYGLSGGMNSGPWHASPIGYTGGGEAHNNMPPYLAVYMWKRTA